MKLYSYPFHLFFMSLLFILTACLEDDDGLPPSSQCINGSGGIVSQVRTLPEFHSLINVLPADIFITQGSPQSVEIRAQQNVLDILVTEVRNEELIFNLNQCIESSDQIEIFLTLEDIQDIRLAGSGNITGENQWNVEELLIALAGSGNIDVELSAENVTSEITGSGNVTIVGNSNNQDIMIIGSGNILGFDLITDNVEVEITGSGNAEVTANEVLDVTILGSGSVFYKGQPVINSTIQGSGSIIDSN